MFQKISFRFKVEHFVGFAIALALLVLYTEKRVGNVHTLFLDLEKTIIKSRLNIEKKTKNFFSLFVKHMKITTTQ